jgi:hypothetical protein
MVLLTEPSYIGDGNAGFLSLLGINTDGVVSNPVIEQPKRIEFLGDSLTAGYGSGFDLPAGVAPANCGAGVLINDVTNDYSYFLADSFNAEGRWVAVSGVTIFAKQPNLPGKYPYTLGSGSNPPKWDFASWVPDLVVMNLGENDMHACNNNCTAAFLEELTNSYVSFVANITKVYNKQDLPIALIIAPHEAGQSVAIIPAVSRLRQLGYNVEFFNATVNVSPQGCGGHPAYTQHHAAFLALRPQIASFLNW